MEPNRLICILCGLLEADDFSISKKPDGAPGVLRSRNIRYESRQLINRSVLIRAFFYSVKYLRYLVLK